MAEFPAYWSHRVPGSSLTSMQVGGVVQYLARPADLHELRETLAIAESAGLPVKYLGGGSNLIISDRGFSGVFIQMQFLHIRIPKEVPDQEKLLREQEACTRNRGRYRAEKRAGMLQLEDLVPFSASNSQILVEMEAGVPWGRAVMWSLQHNLAGLHWYARIPCQIGGAVYNNIHAENHLLSEFVLCVRSLNVDSGLMEVRGQADLDFGYDHSVFHYLKQPILSVVFRLPHVEEGIAKQLLNQYLDWTRRKAIVQPSGPNCGSVFKNISPEDADRLGTGMVAAAWYIDQCGLKGYRIGGMQLYPGHANFIVNTGGGSQGDFISLVEHIRSVVVERFGIWLETEAEVIDEQGNILAWQKKA